MRDIVVPVLLCARPCAFVRAYARVCTCVYARLAVIIKEAAAVAAAVI